MWESKLKLRVHLCKQTQISVVILKKFMLDKDVRWYAFLKKNIIFKLVYKK